VVPAGLKVSSEDADWWAMNVVLAEVLSKRESLIDEDWPDLVHLHFLSRFLGPMPASLDERGRKSRKELFSRKGEGLAALGRTQQMQLDHHILQHRNLVPFEVGP
jgi:hypothetical protein